jgi:2-polyprenyl-6-methoxyphenol hydroxylase-like FAD-dependent oxidoreductase
MFDPEALKDDHWSRKATQQELLNYALKCVSETHPKLTEILRLTKAEGILVPQIEVKDMIPQPIPRGRVTLLGDAVHPMTYCK